MVRRRSGGGGGGGGWTAPAVGFGPKGPKPRLGQRCKVEKRAAKPSFPSLKSTAPPVGAVLLSELWNQPGGPVGSARCCGLVAAAGTSLDGPGLSAARAPVGPWPCGAAEFSDPRRPLASVPLSN